MVLEVCSDVHLAWLHGEKQCSLQLSRPNSYYLTTYGLLATHYALCVAALLVCHACMSVMSMCLAHVLHQQSTMWL